jgi:hypothetical protein
MDEVKPWIERLARLGYASIAAVYAIVGAVTLGAAFGRNRTEAASAREAFDVILRQPFGRVLLIVVGAGMLGYAAWRYLSAIKDTDRRGSDAKGLAIRTGSFIRGLVYTALAVEAFRMTPAAGSDEKARHWTAALMDQPFGRWLVLAAGLAIVGTGIYQMWRAWRAKLGKKLRIEYVTESFRRKVVAISRFGIAARAIVFLVVGVSIVRAAWRHSASAAAGSEGALHRLGAASQWLLAIVAVGLIAYGIYQLLNARYRLIEA